jgi:hypothetical protein
MDRRFIGIAADPCPPPVRTSPRRRGTIPRVRRMGGADGRVGARALAAVARVGGTLARTERAHLGPSTAHFDMVLVRLSTLDFPGDATIGVDLPAGGGGLGPKRRVNMSARDQGTPFRAHARPGLWPIPSLARRALPSPRRRTSSAAWHSR